MYFQLHFSAMYPRLLCEALSAVGCVGLFLAIRIEKVNLGDSSWHGSVSRDYRCLEKRRPASTVMKVDGRAVLDLRKVAHSGRRVRAEGTEAASTVLKLSRPGSSQSLDGRAPTLPLHSRMKGGV